MYDIFIALVVACNTYNCFVVDKPDQFIITTCSGTELYEFQIDRTRRHMRYNGKEISIQQVNCVEL